MYWDIFAEGGVCSLAILLCMVVGFMRVWLIFKHCSGKKAA